MEIKKQYRINVSGCDDETIFDVWLTETEYELVKGICDKCTTTSTYECMPTMRIYEMKITEPINQLTNE